MIYEISTIGPEDTQALAARLGALLKGGETIELMSDLGGGKTTFIQGLARGLGHEGVVMSPTFTLSRIYDLPGGRELHHYDLYRLSADDAAGEALAEVAGQPHVVTAVEWPERGKALLPEDHLSVHLQAGATENERRIMFTATGPSSRAVLGGLK